MDFSTGRLHGVAGSVEHVCQSAQHCPFTVSISRFFRDQIARAVYAFFSRDTTVSRFAGAGSEYLLAAS